VGDRKFNSEKVVGGKRTGNKGKWQANNLTILAVCSARPGDYLWIHFEPAIGQLAFQSPSWLPP